eukprot:2399623-Amphidinium_carterae.2
MEAARSMHSLHGPPGFPESSKRPRSPLLSQGAEERKISNFLVRAAQALPYESSISAAMKSTPNPPLRYRLAMLFQLRTTLPSSTYPVQKFRPRSSNQNEAIIQARTSGSPSKTPYMSKGQQHDQ